MLVKPSINGCADMGYFILDTGVPLPCLRIPSDMRCATVESSQGGRLLLRFAGHPLFALPEEHGVDKIRFNDGKTAIIQWERRRS